MSGTNTLYRGLLVIILLYAVRVVAASPAKSSQEKSIRDILAGARIDDFDSKALPAVFRIGDEHIQELIQAFEDSDANVVRRADKLLRYLGNPLGLAALSKRCNDHTLCFYDGPVPIPLLDSDYDLIRSTANATPLDRTRPDLETFVYALALDSTVHSNTLLSRWLERSRAADRSKGRESAAYLDEIVRRVSGGEPRRPFVEGASLAQSLSANAFFLSPADRKFVKTRLVAKTSAGNKALLEIHIERGVGAERWYHVVLLKQSGQWHIVLVYMFAQG